jgi:hypothetical protein
MTQWQIRAEKPEGGLLLFGVSNGKREIAVMRAMQILEGTGAVIREVTELLPPDHRTVTRRTVTPS